MKFNQNFPWLLAEGASVSLSGAALLLCANGVPFGHYVDDVKWVLLAESFWRGSVHAAWSCFPLAETSITWGFSFFLMPVVALFGRAALAFKFFSALLYGGGFLLCHGAVRPALSRESRVFLPAALGLTGYAVSFSGAVISESAYLFLLGVLAFFAAKDRDPGWEKAAGYGLLAGLLISTRTIGALAPLALAVAAPWMRRGRTGAAFWGALGLSSGPVFLVSKMLSGSFSFYGEYWALAGEGGVEVVFRRALANAHYVLKGLSCLTVVNLPALSPPSIWIKAGAILLMTAWAAAGVPGGLRDPRARFLGIHALGLFAVLTAWSYQAPRYVLMLYPAFVVFLAHGLDRIRSVPWRRAALAAGLIALVATNATDLKREIQRSLTQPPDVPHAAEGWLASHASPEGFVISMEAPLVYYYAGRRGFPFLPSRSPEEFFSKAHQAGFGFVFIGEEAYTDAAPHVMDPILGQHRLLERFMAREDLFAKVYENTEERVSIFALRAPDR